MRRTMTGINLELAAAVRRINTIHDRIPADDQPDLAGESWRTLEAELDRAAGVGDRAVPQVMITVAARAAKRNPDREPRPAPRGPSGAAEGETL